MNQSTIIVLSALTLLSPALAHAEGAGPVAPPAVGAANPAAPAAGSEVPTPPSTQPTLKKGNTALGTNGGIDSATVPPVAAGADTSTAAPGGQADSSKNGALSTPVGPERKEKPATGEETPK